MRRRPLAVSLALALAGAATLTGAVVTARGAADKGESKRERVVGHRFRPAQRPATKERISGLRVPAGFRVEVFARDLGNARMLTVGPNGTVYVSRPERNDVVAILMQQGQPGTPRPGSTRLTASRCTTGGCSWPASGAWSWPSCVRTARWASGGPSSTTSRTAASTASAPSGWGPTGRLYISIGSTCNACPETNPEHAAMLRATLDGRERTVFARGLRNTIGLAWHPDTGELWGMDHGSDWRGDDQPLEELNRIVEGADYGWPFCFGQRRPDEFLNADPPGTTKAAYCARTEAPVLTYQAHAAPIGMMFYTGAQFPAEYRGDAFVAMRGSWNREPAAGYKVVRIRFNRGRPVAIEDFLSGSLIEGGQAQFGRPAGLAVASDGSLLVSEDTNGVIYRISHGGASG